MAGALHELIDSRRGLLLERFLAYAKDHPPRAGITESELKDDLGAVLNQIVFELRRAAGLDAPAPQIDNPARAHGAQRLELGGTLEGLVVEYGVMHRLVLDLAEEAGLAPTFDELRILGGATSAAIRASAAEYMRGRMADLEREATLRERFIAILGHDLRNPLSSMRMAASLLGRGGASPDQLATLGARIARSVERMERMIHELLELAIARSAEGIPIAPEPVDAVDVAREVIDELRLASGASIDLASRGRTDGTWDRDRLARALSNLLGNAIAYRAPESAVEVRIDGSDGEVSIAVHNEGAPIAPEELATIFDPFRRGRAASAGGGIGLGLFIAKQIATSHGGDLRVASSVEGGTTFTIELPRSAPAKR